MQSELVRNVFAPSVLSDRKRWLAQDFPYFGATNAPIYAQHHSVPHDARVHIVGDLHSSFASLVLILAFLHENGALETLDSFALRPNHFVVFLGDVVDRGDFSLELLYIVGQLMLANPTSVFFLQGNHEECSTYQHYTLLQEIMKKFDKSKEVARSFLYFLNYLPSVLFITFRENPNADAIAVSPSAARTVQFCHGAATDNQREQTIIKLLLAAQSQTPKPPHFALLRYWLNGRDDVCQPSDRHITIDNLKWGDFQNTTAKRMREALDYVKEQNETHGTSVSLSRFLEKTDLDVNKQRGGGSLRVFGTFFIEKYLRDIGATAIISGHQDQTNFAFLPPSVVKIDAKKFESDARYGKEHGNLYRPRRYDAIAKGLIEKGPSTNYKVNLYAGTDFIAVNTSSAYSSRFNEMSLKLDCLLTLTQYR